MEVLVFLALLFGAGWLAFKILPYLFKGAWFLILFVGALVAMIGAKVFLDMTNLGLVLGIVGAVGGAWAFARNRS